MIHATPSRLVICLAFFGLLLASAVPASAQLFSLTEVPGLLECPDKFSNCEEYNEAAFVKQHPGLSRRDKTGVTSVRLSNGTWRTVTSEWPNCWHAMALQSGERYLALQCVAEEFTRWKLMDRASGKIFDFDGFPYLSPNGQHIVVAKRNEMEGHILDIFDFTPAGVSRVFRAMADDVSWSPRRVCWLNNETVGYTHVKHNVAGYEQLPGRREYLKLVAGEWRVDASPPAKSDRCTEILS